MRCWKIREEDEEMCVEKGEKAEKRRCVGRIYQRKREKQGRKRYGSKVVGLEEAGKEKMRKLGRRKRTAKRCCV